MRTEPTRSRWSPLKISVQKWLTRWCKDLNNKVIQCLLEKKSLFSCGQKSDSATWQPTGAGKFQYLVQGYLSSEDDRKRGELFGQGIVPLTTKPSSILKKGMKNTVPSLILAVTSYLLEPGKIPEPAMACPRVSTWFCYLTLTLQTRHVINYLIHVFFGELEMYSVLRMNSQD